MQHLSTNLESVEHGLTKKIQNSTQFVCIKLVTKL